MSRLEHLLASGRQFSEAEAWKLFRLAAFAEAIGWTLLIIGIVISTYITPGNRDAVMIAGQLHGTIFFAYIIAAAVFSLSLGWSPKKTIVALAASVPPYGTLVFERYAARSRALQAAKNYRRLMVRAVIKRGQQYFAVQPPQSADWQLPGGLVLAGESTADALKRQLLEQTGIAIQVGDLRHYAESVVDNQPTITLYFVITNQRDFAGADQLNPSTLTGVDELAFVSKSDLSLPWLN